MVFNTGATTRLGRVEDGTTVADYHPEEINRQVTIHTSLVPVEWQGTKINLLDTPGYADFIGEVYAALRVVDSALFVICGVAGVEVQTEIIWAATPPALPRLVFVNKLDRENANFEKALESLRDKFGANFVPLQIPIGAAETFRGVVDLITQTAYRYADGKVETGPVPPELTEAVAGYREKLVEAAAENDDELLSKYLEGEELTPEEIRAGLEAGTREGKLVPVFCGSATRNMGVTLLMDALARYLPAAEGDAAAPLRALVFKTLADPYVGKMSFVRVFAGTLRSDSTVYNPNRDRMEKIGQIFYVRGKAQTPTDRVPAGDMAVVVKLQETATGDTLCEKDKPERLPGIAFPEPNLSVAVVPKTQADEDKLSNAIAKVLDEDPTLRVERNHETRETILTGMGELHLDIVAERLKRKYGADVTMKTPKVPYRETIRAEAKVEGKYKKQTGGRGQYGHVWLRLEPLPDEPFRFTEEIFGGAVPSQYFPAVEKGVREAMQEGVLAGYPVTGVAVCLYDGSFHPVDSSELAFKIAASQAFKKGQQQAKPVLLEPILNVEVTVPEAFMGDVMGDLNTRRGRILGMEPAGNNRTVIRAQVPQAEMHRYATDLRAMTQGRASFRAAFSHYEEVPARLAEEIIKKAREAKEAAEK
jgi:elongation factor G